METRNRKFKIEINGKVSFQDNNLEVVNFTIVNRLHRYHYSKYKTCVVRWKWSSNFNKRAWTWTICNGIFIYKTLVLNKS